MTRLIETTVLLGAVAAAACSTDDAGGRAAAKPTEVETIIQRGSSTTTKRVQITYESDGRVRDVSSFLNGAPDGQAKVLYSAWGVGRIDYTDKDGDKAQETFSFANDRINRFHYEVPQVFAIDSVLTYDAARTDDIKEIANTRTSTGQTPVVWLNRYEYDLDGRLAKRLDIEGTTTQTTELRYDAAGRLDRATSYRGASHLETYTFRYRPEGLLDEVVDSRQGFHTLSYDGDGRITEVRHVSPTTGETTTTRIAYTTGSVHGMTFAPPVPMADLFDLGGASYASVSIMHGGVAAVGDIPRPSPQDGTGGGSGGGGMTCGFTPVDACDSCLATSCCEQTQRCLTGTACYSYYQCASACTTESCRTGCSRSYPGGSSAYDAYTSCAMNYCLATCQP